MGGGYCCQGSEQGTVRSQNNLCSVPIISSDCDRDHLGVGLPEAVAKSDSFCKEAGGDNES